MKRFLFLIFFLWQLPVNSQTTCLTAQPFCTGTNYTFPASTNTPPPSPLGVNFGCLLSQQNPAFYVMEIDNPGNLTISLSSNPVNDIDFICWGPFTNPATMCNQLTAGNIEDCSYSWLSTETCQINGASAGDYYILLITNFSNSACNINFSQTAGNGTSNCCVLSGDAGNDNTYNICDSDSSFIMENKLLGTPDVGGSWYNSNWIATGSNNFDPTSWQSGTYAYIVQGPISSCPYDTSYLTVSINPSPIINFPTLQSVCINESPINLNSATPFGGNYSGIGVNLNIFNPSLSLLGNNIITYSYTDASGCSDTDSQSIIVNDIPFATALTTNVSCNGFSDGSAVLTISGGVPNYTTDWGSINPLNLTTGSFEYTVIDNNNCTYSDSIFIFEPDILTSSINSTNIICNGDNNGTAVVKIQGPSTPTGTVSNLSYCTSSPGSNNFSNIEKIQLIGDNFSINNNTSTLCDQYEDYTSTLFADLTEGQSYTLDIDLGVCSGGNVNNYPSGAKVFIDWNIDGDFTDFGEEVANIANGISISASLSITVPFTGVYGPTRMRVVSQFQSMGSTNPISSCDVGTWAPSYIEPWFGSTEDYSIVVNSASITATYLWNNLATTDSIYNLSPGNYSVDITDGNGCILNNLVTITEPNPISVTSTISPINCYNGNEGAITLNINGGNPDYSVSIPPYSQILTGGSSSFSTSNILNAGSYSYTIIDSNNCSSLGIISLSNPNQLLSSTNITSCDIYTWNGNTYNYSIIQTDTLVSQNNCDSLATLNLTITNSSLSNLSITECDSYLWNGNNYTTSGLYDSLFTNSANCDSTASLSLTINYSSSYVINNTSCDSYTWSITNQTYINSGIYTQISTNNAGCTHIDSLILNINNSAISSNNLSSCDSYIWNNNNYLSSGIYTDTLITSLGCDSIVTLNLTITDTSSTRTIINSCDLFIWTANSQTYLSSIIDTIITTNGNNCPNIDSLLLTINYSDTVTDTQIACDTYQWIDGNTYTSSSNTATFLTTNINGCDSLISLDITINNSSSSFLSKNNCISYEWPLNNQTYTNSGIYTNAGINSNGCINTDTLSLTINSPNSGSENVNTCFFYNWNGNTYNTSGVYTDTLSNVFGCDSIATLNLSISDTSFLTTKEVKCTSYLWPINNTFYTNSGTYIEISTNANGCTHIDSLILIINNTTFSYDTISSCDSYNWNGNTFNTSGNYNLSLINSAGCDSIANLYLTISYSSAYSFSISECNSYVWQGTNYNMSGTYIQTLNTIDGCDSIVTLNLIVISGTLDIKTNINVTDVNCFGKNNGSINLYPSGGISPLSFSWDNGEVTQNIDSLTSGNYSFRITDSIGCTLDSNVSVNEPDQLIVNFEANNEICRFDSISIFIELANPKYNYYTVQFLDSIPKSIAIDSSGNLISEGMPYYITPNFSNQIVLISVTDNNGCTSNKNETLDIIVNQLPKLEINQEDICEGTPSFILNKATPFGGNYFINKQNTNFFDIENLENGAYTIGYEYTDTITSCKNSIEKTININANPNANFSFSPQLANIDNPNILFINESKNIEKTRWQLGDGLIIDNEIEFWHTYADTGTYEIIYTVHNKFNCLDSIKSHLIINPVYQIYIPSAFSPNNDGINDTFKVEIIGQKNYTMVIYNKWGEIIYQKENGGWNGEVNNNIIQHGLYSYTILVNDFKGKIFTYTGNVSLIR